MVEFKTRSLANAYKSSIQHIVWPQNHRELITEDKEHVWRSKETISIHVSDPSYELDKLIEYYPWGKQAMDEYVGEVLGTNTREVKGSSDDFTYTYNERLCAYEVMMNVETIGIDGVRRYQTRVKPINQIDEIIDKLNSSPATRRATAITWYPYTDNYTNVRSPPCLQWLKCEVVDGYLNMFTVWRSRDVLLGMGANIYAIHHLHKMIAERCNCKVGFYEDISTDAHIYYKRDGNHLQRWL